jgi:hypothetical protein
MLLARLPELGLELVEDGRRRSGLRWSISTLLTATLLGLMAGCHSVAEVEELMAKLPIGLRRRLKLPPVRDTTLRDALVRLHPYEVRAAMARLVNAAFRRGVLSSYLPQLPFQGTAAQAVGPQAEALPFHAVSLDGKYVTLKCWDDHYAQQHEDEKNRTACGLVRVVNSVLSTSQAKVVLDAMPIPAETNEMGIFPHALDALVRKFGDRFEMVLYDAGATSEANMSAVVAAGKSYLFCLADARWQMYQKAKRILGSSPHVQAQTEDVESKREGRVKVRSLFIATAPGGYRQWKTVRTLLRIRSQTVVDGSVVDEENHYFASSKAPEALTPAQWMALIRTRWCVENELHCTLDKEAFQEDDRPWIVADPKGTVVVMLLRRIAFSLLALFRATILKAEPRDVLPWRKLLDWVYDTLIASTIDTLTGLRPRGDAVRS